eukprot:233845-Pyramimonas_sp.AAC.1
MMLRAASPRVCPPGGSRARRPRSPSGECLNHSRGQMRRKYSVTVNRATNVTTASGFAPTRTRLADPAAT